MADPIAPPHPLPIASLAGREREQATLRAALDAALAGQGALVLIGGEAGIGKTTLAEWALAETKAQGAQTLVGRCYDLSQTPPYGPWQEALERAPVGDGLPALPAALLPPDREGEPLTSLQAICRRARAYLAALAARRPVALLLDDLHWADPASLELLRVQGRGLSDLPLLILATYRSDELTRRHPLYQLLPLLVREARALRLDLHPLDEAGLRALAGRYALLPADEARLLAYLAERAEGNPFFAGELLRALEEGRALRREDDRWHLGDPAHVGVPLLLRQVLDARLMRLGAGEQGLLAAAAVIGQAVPLAVWQTVTGAGEDALLAAVERAAGTGLLVETPGEDAVRFAHALIREALYDGTPGLRRRRLHRRAAEALAAQSRPDPDAVAYHFQRADDPRAADWLERAGARAHRAYAWATAAARLEAALALCGETDPDAAARARLLLRLAVVTRYADPAQSLAALDEAIRGAARSGDAAVAAFAGYYRGLLRCFTGDPRRGVAELAAGADALDALDAGAQARLATLQRAIGFNPGGRRGTVALWCAHLGRYAEARAQAERAVADAPDPAAAGGYGVSGYADAFAALAGAHAVLGAPEAARAAYERARDTYRAVGHHVNLGQAAGLALIVIALPYHADDLAWRRQLAETADATLVRAGDTASGYRPGLARAPLWLVAGDWAALGALDVPRGNAPVGIGRWVLPSLGAFARARGDHEGARRIAQDLAAGGPGAAPGDAQFWAAVAGQRLAAALALDDGDHAAARAWLQAHDPWLAWAGAVLGRAEGALGWAAYHRAAGDLVAARGAAEQARAHAANPRQPLALLAAHRLLGELDTAEGRHAEAQAHHAAQALADACQAPYERALTLLALADLRATTDDRADATSALAAARTLLEPLGARPALARAEALAARLATPAAAPPPAAAALPGGLTPREAEVLRLVARGLSNADVAGRLFLSPRTVNTHLTSIYTKLGVDNRAAATRLAVERGLT
jgi:DNA-binding CsgD family transcriptional regulator